MEKLRKRGVALQFTRGSCFDCSALGPRTADIGKNERACIAGAGLYANMPAPAGKSEHQDHVGLMRQQVAQIAVDRCVGRRKDMAHDLDPGERRTAAARECNRQAAAWIARRTGKRAETGDYHLHVIFAYNLFRKLASTFWDHARASIATIFSTAEAGASFPAATSASMRGKAVLSARSERNGSNSRSSSMVHIHFTCCSPRRDASSSDAVSRARWSRTCAHSVCMPSPVSAEQVTTGGDQFGERGERMCSAAPNCEAASLARETLSPSVLLTAIRSASSTTPFLSACSSSPAPGIASTKKKSVMSATAISDCPTPTVSTSTTR